MELSELISEINKSIEKHNLVTARKYIEGNVESLNQNKHRLKGNARKLLNLLKNRTDSKPLNRHDLAVIHTINHYASRLDVRGIRIVLKDNISLFLREDSIEYLSSDAKIFLESMGAIPKKS